MTGVLSGFATILAIIAVGFVAARVGVVPKDGDRLIARIVFTIAMPALMFITMVDANLSDVFSPLLVGVLVSSLAMAGLFLLVVGRRMPLQERIIGALSASYVNAGNLGIPIAVYVLGNPAVVAPVLFVQLLVLAPLSLSALDLLQSRAGGARAHRPWLIPFTNPIVIGALAGLGVGATGWELPTLVRDPIALLAGAAVPLALIAYGVSLWGAGGTRAVRPSRELWTATVLKNLIHPAFAFTFGHVVLGLDPFQVFALTVLAALPTAQNIYVYALKYDRGVALSRSSILTTTALSIPVLVVIAALLS